MLTSGFEAIRGLFQNGSCDFNLGQMMRTPESVPPLQTSISYQREDVCPSCLKCTRPYAWWTLAGIEFHNSPVPNLTAWQIVGNSVESERLVSTFNDVVSDERCRLTDQHIA
ncbi:hypothetical protein AVEN_184310-1 [Araneus ventricosus]|uniref:Uncharacterized protein n=1 Tax=Araneus ventricosus TaxID=182803 RepID=A0A4Y2K221_ARAVE|nr:hypothetical protein AVEN_184310-1 [Araneus ventricosus]